MVSFMCLTAVGHTAHPLTQTCHREVIPYTKLEQRTAKPSGWLVACHRCAVVPTNSLGHVSNMLPITITITPTPSAVHAHGFAVGVQVITSTPCTLMG